MLNKSRLIAEYVRSIGILEESQVKNVLKSQVESGGRLSDILTGIGFLKIEQLRDLIVQEFSLARSPIFDMEIPFDVLQKVKPNIAYRHRMVPIKYADDVLTVATDDPINLLAQDNLEDLTGCKLNFVLTSETNLSIALEKHYGGSKNILDAVAQKKDSEIAVSFKGAAGEVAKEEEKEEAPIIKLVTQIIAEAVKNRASDIHVEPLEDKFRIRYRIDGVLHEVPGPPKQLQPSIISRLKIMAGMNIAEKRLPQDGRIRIHGAGKDLDLRVSTLPALYGESVVMRILDKSSFMLGLKELGFLHGDADTFERLIHLPYGMLLITGPTGSGKTTTLYASLSYINKPNKKLITIEDPVEYQISGINQVHVKPSIGLTFASGLRTMLRQAPDVIMVGEIRDFETASIAIQAALTGHLLFSTLHTNDAAGAFTRLIDMGVKSYLVSSTVQAVMAQRLVRKICDNCRENYQPSLEELYVLGYKQDDPKASEIKLWRGHGCKNCNYTGYRGRIGIFELLINTDEIREMIIKRLPSPEIRDAARKHGMKLLREDGLSKALEGITTISEVVRITHGYEE
ncbi:MAG: ATPase, T2SS/T4P/T4SS family [Candidatus Omnitrophica bacterium]|nr:ATPase, T2SS/T4P/T4SS family [Candidatus Omnitrophota bacterium]MDD5310755.1 ATPase, T2SS/T4P/T4SS family [Candidatus Omnitrophota bacterium]MDD5545562.1 ATPase, T2SS/T4P/T4SS family [Candidatus Omnitrophota bacterium]